ncbi:hypothetical protein NM688_g6506 [Phlebia brevispora]|uniref:Uncharacterized protein n=1 Tax=Phlebia brevispora TaxID=194682 RepID=A0ACC1SFE6_9APHY|nr:hypothetical protein NM688_g6506 [Phlebia brevispora]
MALWQAAKDLCALICIACKVAMRTLQALTFLSILCLATADSVVDLGYAKYRGNLTFPNAVAYLGIPYAEPPLGEQRFRAPLPLNTSRVAAQSRGEVVDATAYPLFCVQGSTGQGDAGGAGSEDCLKINVYAPKGAKKGDKLPVLFYMHGGGYVYGNPRNWPFDPWINQVPDVVITSVYYRLDSFGFLSHPAFSTSPELGDHNVGFLDQREALRWVQENIDAFGGDPTRVTINGQSAGASSVELHLVAPGNEGLFSGAIAQSVYRAPLPNPEEQEPLFDFYASKAGCGAGSLTQKMACLRSVPISALAPAQDATFNGSYNVFHPVLDGKTITVRPTESILEGIHSRVPLIVGSTSNETNSGGSDFDTALKSFFPALTTKDLDEFNVVYAASNFGSESEQFRDATGESQFKCAVEIMGDAFAQEESNVYTYRYNTPADPAAGNTIVEHASENWMMFDGTSTGFNGTTTFQPMTPSDRAFAEELIAYWLSFVRTGNPNTFKLARSPVWKSYTPSTGFRAVLQEGTVNTSATFVEQIPAAEVSRCSFVASKALAEQA